MRGKTEKEDLQGVAALYALGMLTQHEARAFEGMLATGDPDAVNELGTFNQTVAMIGLSVEERSPADSLRSRLLSRLESIERSLDEPEKFVDIRADEGEWKELSEGVLVKHLFADHVNRTVTTLVKLLPGARIERHFHESAEQCFILEGDFRINDKKLGPGDFHLAQPGTTHDVIWTKSGALSLIIGPEHYAPLS